MKAPARARTPVPCAPPHFWGAWWTDGPPHENDEAGPGARLARYVVLRRCWGYQAEPLQPPPSGVQVRDTGVVAFVVSLTIVNALPFSERAVIV